METRPNKGYKRIHTTNRQILQQLLALLITFTPLIASFVVVSTVKDENAANLIGGILMLSGLPYMIFCLFAACTMWPFSWARRLRPKIVKKVQAVYGEDAGDAPMVGFSPGIVLNTLAGDSSSDFGLLVLKPGMMTYYGDTMTFGLSPQQIEDVQAVEQRQFIMKVPRVLVGWRPAPNVPLQGFALEAWDASNLWQSRRAVQTLREKIESWRTNQSV